MYSSTRENEDPHEDLNDKEYLIDLKESANGISAGYTLRERVGEKQVLLL